MQKDLLLITRVESIILQVSFQHQTFGFSRAVPLTKPELPPVHVWHQTIIHQVSAGGWDPG